VLTLKFYKFISEPNNKSKIKLYDTSEPLYSSSVSYTRVHVNEGCALSVRHSQP